jgi:endo-1,4-beta-xylanase
VLTGVLSSHEARLSLYSPRCAHAVRISSLRKVSAGGDGASSTEEQAQTAIAGAGASAAASERSDASIAGSQVGATGQSAEPRSLAPSPGAEAQAPPKRTITIGTAVGAGYLAGADPRYRQTLIANFSGITPENEMKWETIEPAEGVFDYAPAEYIVDFATAHGMSVHGHNLVWNKQLPGWLTSKSWTRSQLEAILHQHIAEVVGHFRGQVHEWDVVNEPFNNDGTLKSDIWSTVIGPEYIALALRWAHEADPTARLFINDYDIDWDGPKRAAMVALATRLKAEGVPLDGIGMEEHVSLDWAPSEQQIEESMQSFQALGLEVEVTEMDVAKAEFAGTNEEVEAAKAIVFAAAAHACRAVSACTRFSVWGVSDAVSWLGEGEVGLPFNGNYEPTPSWLAIQSNLENP